MTAVIFAGPSIYGLDIPSPPNLVFRPPAKQGDVFRATLARPRAIGIIDGYFDGVPSVWHKEILWALSEGVRVFGGASMGALRVAELDGFGMTGVGRIYRWYRDGVLEDDDEVALIHAPEDGGFLALSEPMVNLRATCEAAVRAQILDQPTAEAIVAIAKSQNYRERTWESVIAAAGADRSRLENFTDWLHSGRVDQKRLDAAELIEMVAAFLQNPGEVPRSEFRFEWTDLWERALDEWAVSEPHSGDQESVSQAAVIDEVRLDPDRYVAIRAEALQRGVLLREADRRRLSTDRRQKLQQLALVRRRLSLLRKADLDAWAKQNGVDADQLETLMEDAARIEAVSRLSPGSIDRHILAILRLSGDYAAAAARARAKRHALESSGFLADGRLAGDVSPPMLLAWFFGKRLRQAIPDDLDRFVASLGFTGREAFYRLLAAEYLYSQAEGDGVSADKAAVRRSEP